jgi:hypothetical protein
VAFLPAIARYAVQPKALVEDQDSHSLDFVRRRARMRAWFFKVSVRSQSGAPLVGAPKQFFI